MLLCLLTAKRGVALHLLKLSDFFINSSKTICQIVYSAKDKSTRPGFHSKPAIFQSYPDKKLCILDHYNHYVQRTANLRSSTSNELFVTLQKPHKAISRATLFLDGSKTFFKLLVLMFLFLELTPPGQQVLQLLYQGEL